MTGRSARVAERIRAFAGLDPPAWLLEARLAERARALGLDLMRYLELASGDGDEAAREQAALADLLRVGETRFFRHRAHVTALRERVIPERAQAAAREARPLSAWSAGCATGEEAFTLALLLDEAEPPTGFEVLATDLSEEALACARRAIYPAERVAEVPAALRARGFDGESVRPSLRARVRFERHNLTGARYPTGFDLILCRNVLIYFDAEARDRVIARLWNSLQPGGYLFVGYSESLRDHQARFFALRSEDGVIYRRREPNQPDPDAPSANAAPTARPMVAPHPLPIALPPSPAAPQVAAPSRAPAPPPRLALSGDYTDGARLAAELRPLLAGEGAVVDLDGAGFLGDEAARVLERATRAAPGLVLTARRPAVRRWLWRHRLAPSEDE